MGRHGQSLPGAAPAGRETNLFERHSALSAGRWGGLWLLAFVLLIHGWAGRAHGEDPAAGPLPEGWRPALVREAMVATLTGDAKRLAEVRGLAAACEARAAIPRNSPDSLDPLMALLQACAEPMPKRREAFLEEARNARSSPATERQVRRALAEEPGARIERIRRQDRYNRFTVVFNFFSNLATNILTVNIQAVTQRLADLFIISESATALTSRDRLAIDIFTRWRQDVERLPESSEPAPAAGSQPAARGESRAAMLALAPYAERLESRHKAWTVLESVVWGEWHLAHDRPEEAYAAFGEALEREPGNSRARAGRLAAARRQSADLRARIASVESPPRTPTPSPEVLARTQLDAADGERRGDVRHFIWSGDLPDSEGPRVFTARDRIHRSLAAIGILAPVGWIVRSVRCSIGKPVPDAPWRDAAARYLAEAAPSSDPTSEWNRMAKRLAESYESGNDSDNARLWHDRARGEPDPVYAARLDEKAAGALRTAAMDAKDPELKRAILTRAVDHYGHTKSGAKASQDLAKLGREVAAGKYLKSEEQIAREREEADTAGEKGPAVPVALEADLGDTGFDVYPRLLPLPFDPEKLPLYR